MSDFLKFQIVATGFGSSLYCYAESEQALADLFASDQWVLLQNAIGDERIVNTDFIAGFWEVEA